MKIRTIMGLLLVLALVLGSTGVAAAASDCPNPDCPNPDCPNPDCPNPDCPNPDCPNPDCPNPDCPNPDCDPIKHLYSGPGPHGNNKG
jgi:hypothetical protein